MLYIQPSCRSWSSGLRSSLWRCLFWGTVGSVMSIQQNFIRIQQWILQLKGGIIGSEAWSIESIGATRVTRALRSSQTIPDQN